MSRASRKRQYRRRAGALRDLANSLAKQLNASKLATSNAQRNKEAFANAIERLVIDASEIGVAIEFKRDIPTDNIVIAGERMIRMKPWRSEREINKHEARTGFGGGERMLNEMLLIVRQLRDVR